MHQEAATMSSLAKSRQARLQLRVWSGGGHLLSLKTVLTSQLELLGVLWFRDGRDRPRKSAPAVVITPPVSFTIPMASIVVTTFTCPPITVSVAATVTMSLAVTVSAIPVAIP